MKKVFTIILGLLSLSSVANVQEDISVDTIYLNPKTLLLQTVDTTHVIKQTNIYTKNWFLWGSVGLNALQSEANRKYDRFYNRLKPEIRLNIGKWITDEFAIRAGVGFGQLSGHFYPFKIYNMYDKIPDHATIPQEAMKYMEQRDGMMWFARKFTFMDFQVNVMTDVVQWFSSRPRNVAVYLYAGPGYVMAFGSQGISSNQSLTLNAGGAVSVKVSNRLAVVTELKGTIVDGSFTGQLGGYSSMKNRTLSGFDGVTIGLSYRFMRKRTERHKFRYPVVTEIKYYEPKVEHKIVYEVDTIPANRMLMPIPVRFFIDKYNIEDDQKLNIHEVATYLIDNPTYKLSLNGYADKETAYPRYNMWLSERRNEAVMNYIISNYGIAKDRFITKPNGDLVRAYQEDYRWNRAVVMQIIIDTNN